MKPIPRRLRREHLPAVAEALGVALNGDRLRAGCPVHGGVDLNLSVFVGDDDVLVAKCHSYGCKGIIGELRDLIVAGGYRGDGTEVRIAPPAELPTAEQLATWSDELLTSNDRRLTDQLREAGWSRHRQKLAHLGIGFDGIRLVLPTREGDGALVGAALYAPGTSQKMRALRSRPRGLFPVLESVEGERIFVFEGEPDAVTATLAGLPATGVPCAGGWRDEWAQRFIGRRVVISFDCDDRGRDGAEAVAVSLRRAGVEVVVIDLDPTRSDGFDFRDLVKEVGSRAAAERLHGLADDSTPDAIDGAALLDEVVALQQRYVRFVNDEQVHAQTLYVATTHAFAHDSFDTAPYLGVTSAEKRSGKTRNIEVLEQLVPDPWRVSAMPTISSFFRVIDARRPVVLLDEADETFASNGDEVKQIKAALNAGYRRGATVPRTEGDAKTREVVNFSVFCMKVLAGIGAHRWPDTTRDRCIVIELQRRTDGERVARYRHRHAAPELNDLRDRLAEWAEQNADALRDHEPADMPEINDRAFEVWEPMLSIAAIVGGPWPERARRAAIALSGSPEIENESIGIRLLADLRSVFTMHSRDGKLASAAAIDALNAMDDAPWRNYRDGAGIDPYKLGRLLRPYAIRTRSLRVGETTAKGWERDDLADAWRRYLPPPGEPDTPGTSGTPTQAIARHNGDVPHVPDVPHPTAPTRRSASDRPNPFLRNDL